MIKLFVSSYVVLELVLGDIERLWTCAELSSSFSSCEETDPYPRDT